MAMREFVTLMYFRSRGGKVRSLKVPKIVLTIFFIVAALVVFLAVFSTSLMMRLYEENRGLLNELNAAKAQKKTLVEKKLPAPKMLPNEKIKPSQSDVAIVQNASPPAAEEEKKKIVENKIFVGNTIITETAGGKSFKLKFDMFKGKDKDGQKITGSVVVVGKTGEKYFAYPPGITVKGGVPLNYKKGERFVVVYRKKFEKTFPYPRNLLESLTVFLYDEKGGLLLKENVGLR